MSGWIKLHRQITEHWIWQDPVKLKRWLIMLQEVNYTTGKMIIGNTLITITPGQSTKSLNTWSELLGCSKKTVITFFDILEKDGMITREIIGKGNRSTTLINITNFKDYQGIEEPNVTPQTPPQAPPQAPPNVTPNIRKKESKEGKEGKKVFIPPTIFEVTAYFAENGYKKEAAEKAFKYYDAANWIDSKGSKVRSWKQKMQGVWFKDENKEKTDQPRKMVY